jgi:hypothetical protein
MMPYKDALEARIVATMGSLFDFDDYSRSSRVQGGGDVAPAAVHSMHGSAGDEK